VGHCVWVVDDRALAEKLAVLRPHLNERQWRLLLGAEAESLGRGGIAVVARASGAACSTVQAGVAEVRAGVEPDGRVRAAGGGRPMVELAQPGIEQALDELVSPETRGDPCSPLRWTTKSLSQLTKGLYAKGFTVSKKTVGRLLKQAGYRLQAVFKTKEGASHPDRDAQFRYINTVAAQFLACGDPVISVDTKKKELVGEYAQGGREYQRSGQPVEVNGHDFPHPDVPRAIPYGVYDVGADDGFVAVGIDHDTAAFAVNAIRTWWDSVGRHRYAKAGRLLVTADCGGSNGYRLRAWKHQLTAFAAETGLQVTVCHFPPGTSKWNKVEHRLFSFISINWRGRPLTDYQVIIETIAATTTETGLTVQAVLDEREYPTGVKVTDAQMKAIPLQRHGFHGEWNYVIHSGPIPESLLNQTIDIKPTE
jgi:DDE family transposase